MERWVGKIAVVTGAASGIGAAITARLLDAGVIVVGMDISVSATEDRSDPADPAAPLHWVRCDVTSEADVTAAFAWVDERLGGVDILVNNAGILRGGQLIHPASMPDIVRTLDVNVLGVVRATREAFQSMKRRQCGGGGGHVILINSTGGHVTPYFADSGVSFNAYQPSKFAITAMTEVLRQEFQMSGLPIKVSAISPGFTETNILPGGGEMAGAFAAVARLRPEDVAQTVMFALATPPHVQIHSVIVKPMGEKF